MSANGYVVVEKIKYEVLFLENSNSEHLSSNFDLKYSSGSRQEEGLFGIFLQVHVRVSELLLELSIVSSKQNHVV
jgi:hypothetical protein